MGIVPVSIPNAARSVATDIYWLMPGPRAFIEAVIAAIVEHRWLAIRTPSFSIPGFTVALDAAVQRAHLDNERARWVRIYDSSEVAAQVGTVFNAPSVLPSQLALMHGPIRSIVLDPTSELAVAHCEQYLEAFVETVSDVPRTRGQVCLIALLPQSHDATKAPVARCPQEIVFSGALTAEEMQAYVAVRMTDRSGPDSTGLLRWLVTEFAGFDAQLAEELMAMSDELLLALPKSLEALSAQADNRWRTGRWSTGCYANVGGKTLRHVLHELHLSRHAGPEQRVAAEWLKRRYWRACLRSLLPWLEERRSCVIEVLRGPLEEHLRPTGGKATRITRSGSRIETHIDDLEYNQIPGLVFNEGFRVTEPRQKLAVELCFAAKRVRDDMAHLRPPEVRAILELVDLMNRLLTQP